MDDKCILKLFFCRDEQAISEAKIKYESYCFKIAYNILGNIEDSEECVSDAFVLAWNSIPPNSPEKLGAYLSRLTRNAAINRYRKNSAQKRGGSSITEALDELKELAIPDNAVEQVLYKELMGSINAFLESLSVKERNIFLCRYYYGFSIRGMSETFKMHESHIRTVLSRTRKKLQRFLAEEALYE